MKKEESEFISLAEAAKITSYSQDYISLLCRLGKLKAKKLGRNWVTTKEWVYSYIDNTEGKGKTIIPVNIKKAGGGDGSFKDVKAKSGGGKHGEGRKIGRGTILDCAIFCTISLIILANIVSFAKGMKEVEDISDKMENYTYMNAIAALKVKQIDELKKAKEEEIANCPACEEEKSLKTISFEKETDPAAIEEVRKQAGEEFTKGELQMEVYKNFAIVNYKNKPSEKFLYFIKK